MKDLTRNELLERWLKSQGDVTLVPSHPNRKVNKKECKQCFEELLKRTTCGSSLKGVSR